MLNHAISASKAGVGHSAQQKQDSAWTKWTGFLKAANIRGCFLEDKNRLEKSASLLRSRSRLDIITLAERLKLPFEETPSELQSLKWERPSGRMDLPTPEMMPMDASTPQ